MHLSRPFAEKVSLKTILADPAIRAVIGMVFFVLMGLGTVLPILPLFARSFGVGYDGTGLLISAFGLTRLVGDLAAGWIIDRFGERYAGAAGMLFLSLCSTLTGIAPNFAFAVGAWGLAGMGSALMFASFFSYVLKVTPQARIGRTLSFFYGAFNMGIVAGGVLGGQLAAAFGLASPLFAYSVLLLIPAFIYLRFVPEPVHADVPEELSTERVLAEREAAPPQHGGGNLRDFLKIPGFKTTLVVNLAYLWMVAAIFNTLLPLFGRDELGLSTSGIGVIFAVAVAAEFIVIYPAGAATDRYGRRAVMLPASGIMAVMVVSLGFSTSPLLLAVLISLMSFAGGFAGVPPAAMLSDIVPSRHSGKAVGVFRFCGDVGFFIGPLLAGLLAKNFGFKVAFAVSAIPVFVAFFTTMRAPETLRKDNTSPSQDAVTPA